MVLSTTPARDPGEGGDASHLGVNVCSGNDKVIDTRHDRTLTAGDWAGVAVITGDAFISVEIDSSPGNLHGIDKDTHWVVTNDLVDEPDHLTRKALDHLMEFFDQRLHEVAP